MPDLGGKSINSKFCQDCSCVFWSGLYSHAQVDWCGTGGEITQHVLWCTWNKRQYEYYYTAEYKFQKLFDWTEMKGQITDDDGKVTLILPLGEF